MSDRDIGDDLELTPYGCEAAKVKRQKKVRSALPPVSPKAALRETVERFGAAMHKLGQEEVRRSDYLDTAIKLAAEANVAVRAALRAGPPEHQQAPESWLALMEMIAEVYPE